MHTGRAALLAAAMVAIVADAPAASVYAIAVLEGMLATIHRPANNSLLPGLARSPEELVAGNAVASTMEGVGVLVGPAIAGLLVAGGGPALGAALAAGSFGAAAGAISLVEAARFIPPPSGGHVRDALAGLRALRTHRMASVLVGLFSLQTFVRGLLTVLIVGAAVGPLGLGDGGVGYLNAAMGAGGLIGAVAAMGLIGRRALGLPFTVSLAVWGAPMALMGLLPTAPAALVFLAAIGIANAVLDVSGFSLIQRIVPNQVRGRVFGAMEGIFALMVGLGSLVAPGLIGFLGVEGALVLAGLILPVAAVVSAPLVRRADAAAVLPEQELGLLRSIPFFAPLPMTSLEALAAAMTVRRVPAGTTLIREGEPGDQFHILSTGRARISVDGRSVREIGPGEGVGEIALLRDVPRTATVTLLEDAEVYDLGRSAFLEAVTGSRQSLFAADALVGGRLGTSISKP
jgi:MFS family permease